MMTEALVELQVGNIDCAIAIVANAFSLFESEMISLNRGDRHDHQCEYLPGLLFFVCLRCVISDHVSLREHIPTCLSPAFSRAISTSFEPMRAHCLRVLNGTNLTSDLQEEHTCHRNNKTELVAEWTDLVSTASSRGSISQQESESTTSSVDQSWSLMFFVALWKLYCCPSSSEHQSSCSAAHIFVEMSGAKNIPPACSLRIIPWYVASVTFLGVCYEFGVGGVDKDIHKAVTLYQTAVDASHAQAMFNLGVCYENGIGVDKNIHKAVTLYQRAADSGLAIAMCNLGVCYKKGVGVDRDVHKAVLLYQVASDAGDAQAMCNLAVCYKNGSDGIDKDIHKAVTLWQRAADAGHVMAIYNLGVSYYNGDGVDTDLCKAVTLYQRAADYGNTWAMFNLGVCYFNGSGVFKDINKAVKLYQRAADVGQSTAMFHLGVCYYNGGGVEKDIHKALRLWQRAADSGSSQAMYMLALRHKKGSDGFSKDIHEAMRLWLWAAALGHPEAVVQLRILQAKSNT
ncbi:calmodulin-dependent protein kinase [Pelomyxa schiedti]|nr:calmodulin-dependent protein kinase [Pelomyxa schiedti]